MRVWLILLFALWSTEAPCAFRHGSGTVLDPIADKVLVVYNTSSSDSVAVKDYYLANRPNFANVNTLAISTADVEIMSQASFQTDIRTPIVNWLQGNPSKTISYVVLMRGIPDRISGGGTSVQVQISTAFADLSIRTGAAYGGPYNVPYVPANFPGTTALVTHLNMGSLAATTAYIDKLKAMYLAMATPNTIISAAGASLGGASNYILDDVSSRDNTILIDELALLGMSPVNVPAGRITYSTSTHPPTGVDVLGFETWGVNGGLGSNYALNGNFVWSGHSGWWLIKTGESFNGQPGGGQGNYTYWFAATAFGGTGYSNTPVGAVTHVEEPLTTGINDQIYLENWENGLTFGEAAWASRQTPYFMAVGDPFVKR